MSIHNNIGQKTNYKRTIKLYGKTLESIVIISPKIPFHIPEKQTHWGNLETSKLATSMKEYILCQA